MRARPSGQAGFVYVIAIVLVVACAAPTPTQTLPASSGETPQASGPGSTESATAGQTPGPTPVGGPIGEGPIGGAENQPTPVDTTPTSSDLILADVAGGKIDADTGLLYRLYASFGDQRLPSEYATSERDVDEEALAEAAYRVEAGDLPATIADQIRPFTLRPTNPDSALYVAPEQVAWPGPIVPAVAVAQDQPACGANGWASLKSASQPVKVWVRCNDARLAGLLADALAAADTLYSEESDAQMMGPAILDSGALLTPEGIDAGGDNSIDIYFTPTCVQRAGGCTSPSSIGGAAFAQSAKPYNVANAAWTSSAFIVIDRAYGDSKTDIWSLIAHEMFHVLQYAHNGYTYAAGKRFWFVEASAKWSQQYFVPDARPRWTYPNFNRFQAAEVGLGSTDNNNPYDSFVWAYFMEQKTSYTKIADAWRALEGKVGFEALNAAMTGTFSFEENFKNFAVQALNVKLQPGDPAEPEMQVPDAFFPLTAPSAGTSASEKKKQLALGVFSVRAKDDPVTIPVAVPPLGVRYHVFGVGDNIAKLTFDFSDVQPAQAMDVEALVLIHDKGWERRSLPDGKTTFCRDRADDDIDGGILVFADHSWADAENLSGTYKVEPLDTACIDGSFSMDLSTPASINGKLIGAGHYDGELQIECDKLRGEWNVAARKADPPTPVWDFWAFNEGAQVTLRDFLAEGGTPWFVHYPDDVYHATLSIKVDDTKSPATFKILATNDNRNIKIDGTCSHVTRDTDTPPPPP